MQILEISYHKSILNEACKNVSTYSFFSYLFFMFYPLNVEHMIVRLKLATLSNLSPHWFPRAFPSLLLAVTVNACYEYTNICSVY